VNSLHARCLYLVFLRNRTVPNLRMAATKTCLGKSQCSLLGLSTENQRAIFRKPKGWLHHTLGDRTVPSSTPFIRTPSTGGSVRVSESLVLNLDGRSASKSLASRVSAKPLGLVRRLLPLHFA
jgi:hypothetical protein